MASIALNVANGTKENPEGRDAATVANKLRAANAFTEAYVEAGADYGELRIEDTKLWLGDVESSETSVTAALDRLPDLLEMFSGPLLFPVSTASCAELYSGLRVATGGDLVALVRGGDPFCIWDLQWITDRPLQIIVSREDNALTIANTVRQLMKNYDGSSEDGLEQAFLYLLIVRDIHYWCLTRRTCEDEEWASAASYSVDPGSPVYEAVRSAVDSFVEHPQFLGYEVRHADNLFEMAEVVSKYDMEEVYLHAVTRWLNACDDRYASIGNFQGAMDPILSIVYNGHRRSEFGPIFGEDRDLIHALRNFVLDERWLGTASQWIMERSALELARYTKYRGTANYDYVLPIIESIRNAYANNTRGESI